MRDFEKSIAQGKAIISKHKGADIRASELEQIISIATNKVEGKEHYNAKARQADIIFYAIANAFYAGVAVGNRQK